MQPPADLWQEIEWRLIQGGMPALFRPGMMECVRQVYAQGIRRGQQLGGAITSAAWDVPTPQQAVVLYTASASVAKQQRT